MFRQVIENSPRANITLKDGSKVNNVIVYRCQYLHDSVIDNVDDLTKTLNGETDNVKLYFGNEFIQGGISSVAWIDKWELCEEDK